MLLVFVLSLVALQCGMIASSEPVIKCPSYCKGDCRFNATSALSRHTLVPITLTRRLPLQDYGRRNSSNSSRSRSSSNISSNAETRLKQEWCSLMRHIVSYGNQEGNKDYVAPSDTLAYSVKDVQEGCHHPQNQDAAEVRIFGVDTEALSYTVSAAVQLCNISIKASAASDTSLIHYMLYKNATVEGIPTIGCNGYNYNGYTYNYPNVPLGFQGCYSIATYPTRKYVPNIFSRGNKQKLFPGDQRPTLYATMLRAFAFVSLGSDYAKMFHDSLKQVLHHMQGPDGLIYEYPSVSATETSFSDPTFYPGPQLTRTRSISDITTMPSTSTSTSTTHPTPTPLPSTTKPPRPVHTDTVMAASNAILYAFRNMTGDTTKQSSTLYAILCNRSRDDSLNLDLDDYPSYLNTSDHVTYNVKGAFDARAQFTVLAALGPVNIINLCPSTGSVLSPYSALCSAFRKVVIDDSAGNVYGLGFSNVNKTANNGKVDKTRVDFITMAMALIAIQRMYEEYSTYTSLPIPNIFDDLADKWHTLARSIGLQRDYCHIQSSESFWPEVPNPYTGYSTMLRDEVGEDSCVGQTASVATTALWGMALSGVNPFTNRTGLIPPIPRPLPPAPPPAPPSTTTGIPASETSSKNIVVIAAASSVGGLVLITLLVVIVVHVRQRREKNAASSKGRNRYTPLRDDLKEGRGTSSANTSKKNLGFF